MIEIVPTVVPNTFEDIVRVADAYKGFASMIHVDVADGVFAPNKTWLPELGDRLPNGMHYEAHLMVNNPHEAGIAFLKAGAESLIGHAEAFTDANDAVRTFEAWREEGARLVQTGVLFQTELGTLEPLIPLSDFTLLMCIASIGVQGIPFEEKSIDRIRSFRGMYPNARINVDGGVSEKNIDALAASGATRFCVGSALSKAENPEAAYHTLFERAEAVAL